MDGPFFILSGAGLSAPSGIPTFRDADGLWEGHAVEQVATPEGWSRDAALVRRFYDERRVACAAVVPNAGHAAIARLQAALGADQVHIVTQNIDGLLGRAGCSEVLEMHGSLWKLRCEKAEDHPWIDVVGPQDPEARCGCGGRMRPAVVWFGEVPIGMERIQRMLHRSAVFVSVGTSGLVYPAAGLLTLARRWGATCIEVNPRPTGGPFHRNIAESADLALPRLVQEILG